jgi:GAF domain-containing protein
VNIADTNRTRDESRLARWGGSYILRMQAITQLISFGAAVVGIVYILAAASLNAYQTLVLFVSVFFFVGLVNALIPIYTAMASARARLRLDAIFKNKPQPPEMDDAELQSQAWHEVIGLPGNYGMAELFTAYILVVIPAVLAMRWIGGVTVNQAIHVAIGGLLSGTSVVVQNTLFLDRMLSPVRRALLPADPGQQMIETRFRTAPRTMIVVGSLIITTIVMLGLLGYQKLLNAAQPGADIALLSVHFGNEVILIGLLILIGGMALARQLSQAVSQPVNEMFRTMEAFQSGNHSRRAAILSSDETAQLTIRLNQMLDELQKSRTGLENQVEERTAELTHRTLQLQASAQVAREAASFQDVNALLSRTVDLVAQRFNFYHAGIFLLDENGDYVTLHAASSEGGKKMIERGHRLTVGQQGIVGVVAYENRVRMATDVNADPAFFENQDLPLTRSEAAFPLAIRGEVIGVLDIQSSSPGPFSQSDIELLQSLADQIALAIQNARLIAETRDTLHRLETASAEAVRRAWGERGNQQKQGYRYTPTGLGPLAQPAEAAPTDSSNRINIPIALRGQKIGSIVLNRKNATTWNEADRSLAIEIANQIGLALENARLLEDAQRRAAQEQTISELASSFSRTLNSDALLQTAVKELHRLPNVEEVSVFIGSPEPASSDEPAPDKG